MGSQNRLLIAIALSLLVMVLYQKLVVAPHAQRAQQGEPALSTGRQQETLHNRIITVSSQEKDTALKKEQKQRKGERVIVLENKLFKTELTDDGARIKQIWLKAFKDTNTGEPTPLLTPKGAEENYARPFLLEDLFVESSAPQRWKLISKDQERAKYFFKGPAGAAVTKEIFFHNSNYSIGLRVKIKNDTATAMPVKYKLTGASALFIKPGIDERFSGADIKTAQETKRLNPRRHLRDGGKIYYEPLLWVSTRGRYFSLALEPKQSEEACFIEKEGKKGVRSGVIIGPITIMPQGTVSKEFLLYAGPNSTEELEKASPNMVDVATFGKLGAICTVLLKLLYFFNSIVHNYGISIILITLAISGALFPLTKKSLQSMKDMQAMQPEIEKLRKEHKNNPQKLNKETMELYKKHKINPLGGCLPMFFQMPIFIALYQVLIKSVELKGASFLWIKDLSEPDAAFKLPVALPVLGEYINILPLLMIIAMFLQQKVAQPKATQTEQQKMMAIMMPLLFGIIFYNLPSGLVLYWLTNTIIMIILQEFVLKVRHTTPKPA